MGIAGLLDWFIGQLRTNSPKHVSLTFLPCRSEAAHTFKVPRQWVGPETEHFAGDIKFNIY